MTARLVIQQTPQFINNLMKKTGLYIGDNKIVVPINDTNVASLFACRDDALHNYILRDVGFIGLTTTATHTKRLEQLITDAEVKWKVSQTRKWTFPYADPARNQYHFFVMETGEWEKNPMRISFLTLLMRLSHENPEYDLQTILTKVKSYRPTDGNSPISVGTKLTAINEMPTLECLDAYTTDDYKRSPSVMRFVGFATSKFSEERKVFIHTDMEWLLGE
jgi:hypothetical protein